MGALDIPKEGITLLGGSSAGTEDGAQPFKPMQAMRLELEEGVLENILRTARSGGKGVHLSFGKTITLDYGNRSKQLSATVQHTPTELYSYTDEKENDVTFSALQTHRLAMKKALEDTVGSDIALARLQNQLASAEREKQARQIQLAPNNIGLPPATSRRDALKSSSVMKRKSTIAQRRPDGNAMSTVKSPSLGAALSTQSNTGLASEFLPEDTKLRKTKALKIPLIHFLAVRPVSEKYLGQTLRCDQEDCLQVLQRVGKPYRLDQSKWDLNDKAFKDLDVWQFNYPSQEDRQLAIDRAVSSYDRSRLPSSHPLWQKLLPYHERGRGRCLSNLKLSDPTAQRGTTPRIHVQSTDDNGIAVKTTGNDSDTRQDRLAPSDAESMSRSKTKSKPGNPLGATKTSEKNGRPKAVPAKDSKNPTQITKRKAKADDKPEGAKKGGRKVIQATSAKSSEFVHDSDEDDDEDMVDVPPSTAKSSRPPAKPSTPAAKPSTPIAKVSTPATKPSAPSSAPSTAKKMPAETSKQLPKAKGLSAPPKHKLDNTQKSRDLKPSVSTPLQSAGKRPPTSNATSNKTVSSDSSQGSIAMSKSLSRQRTTSSPHKPSPLGSSPPTNASELDNDTRPMSSTASTPRLNQLHTVNNVRSKESLEGRVNGVTHAKSTLTNSLKRKAAVDDHIDPPHGRAAPLINGTTVPNGHSMSAKRHKASPISPPASESSTDSSTETKRRQALEEAQRFKKFYEKYQALYVEVAELPKDVPNKKFDDLMKMHERLSVMKAEIAKTAL